MFGSLRDKKRQRVRKKKPKTLVKNLCAIDFLPSWSPPYHPVSHRPLLPPSVLCCVPGEIHSGKWGSCPTGRWGSLDKEGLRCDWVYCVMWSLLTTSVNMQKAKCWAQRGKITHPPISERKKDKALERGPVNGRYRHSFTRYRAGVVEERCRMLAIVARRRNDMMKSNRTRGTPKNQQQASGTENSNPQLKQYIKKRVWLSLQCVSARTHTKKEKKVRGLGLLKPASEWWNSTIRCVLV